MAEGTSAGKRRMPYSDDTVHEAADDATDDLVAAITTKLGGATTRDHDSTVATICEVLGVDASTASFYLEASNNDPHAAVHLHVQNHAVRQPHTNNKRHRSLPSALAGRHVSLAGLPPGWSARVSAAGTIIFVNDESGHEQAAVPPGFEPEQTTPAAMTTEAPAAMDGGGGMKEDEVPASPPMAPSAMMADAAPALASERAAEHPRVTCDACHGAVCGVRYQCLTRFDFDMCEACFWDPSSTLRSGHRWMKMAFVEA